MAFSQALGLATIGRLPFGQLVGIVGNGDLLVRGNDEDFDVAVSCANFRLFSYRGLLGNRPFTA